MPFVMRSTHHITLEEYNERKKAVWPETNGQTLVAPQFKTTNRTAIFQDWGQSAKAKTCSLMTNLHPNSTPHFWTNYPKQNESRLHI